MRETFDCRVAAAARPRLLRPAAWPSRRSRATGRDASSGVSYRTHVAHRTRRRSSHVGAVSHRTRSTKTFVRQSRRRRSRRRSRSRFLRPPPPHLAVAVVRAGSAAVSVSTDGDVSSSTAWPAMRRRIITARRRGQPAAMASDSPKSSKRRMVSRPASRNAPTTARTARASPPRPTSSYTSRRTPRAPRHRPSWTRAGHATLAGLGFGGRARRSARGARRDGARREFRDVPTAEPGKQARAVARRARGARGEIEPREVAERVAAGRRRGGAARRGPRPRARASCRSGAGGDRREAPEPRNGREPSRNEIQVSQTAPAERRSVCPGKESQLCRSRSRERQRPPDRHTRRRGRRYVERASAFSSRRVGFAVAAREDFSKRPAGRDRVSRVHRGVPTFQDLPRSSPALFRSRAGAVSIERELPHGRVAIRPASEPSTATTPDASRPSSPRPLTRR